MIAFSGWLTSGPASRVSYSSRRKLPAIRSTLARDRTMKTPPSRSFFAHAITVAALTCAVSAPLSAQWTGEWSMDMSSGAIAVDISGSGNDGTLVNFNGTPWVPGMVVNALSFDGVDDYVSLNAQASIYEGLGAPYSVAYWVKAPAQPNVFVYAEGATSSTAILIFGSGQYPAQSDKFRVYCRNDQGNAPFSGLSNAVVYDDTWHHIAFVDVSGQITLYVDGVVDSGNIS
ncbi:MAG TPA: hypothetical protein EYP98_07485, partial [Planctomycetes bacterium]|nr:hypothetical protein [Planctomycetota bacterium]